VADAYGATEAIEKYLQTLCNYPDVQQEVMVAVLVHVLNRLGSVVKFGADPPLLRSRMTSGMSASVSFDLVTAISIDLVVNACRLYGRRFGRDRKATNRT
jgi:hypothetical protein